MNVYEFKSAMTFTVKETSDESWCSMPWLDMGPVARTWMRQEQNPKTHMYHQISTACMIFSNIGLELLVAALNVWLQLSLLTYLYAYIFTGAPLSVYVCVYTWRPHTCAWYTYKCIHLCMYTDKASKNMIGDWLGGSTQLIPAWP